MNKFLITVFDWLTAASELLIAVLEWIFMQMIEFVVTLLFLLISPAMSATSGMQHLRKIIDKVAGE